MTGSETELAVVHPSTARWLIGSFEGWFVFLLCFILVGLPVLVSIWITRLFTKYTITTERLIIQRGIIFRRIDEIELYRVKDIRVDFSLLNQLVNIGTITLTSSDMTHGGVIKLAYIEDARKLREMMRNCIETARRLRGVREVDAYNERPPLR